MKIAVLKASDFFRFDQLASECGTIFNSIKWLGLFGDKISAVGIYNDNNDLIGGFHLYMEKKFGLTVCRDAPFTPHCGPFLKVTAKNSVAIMDAWKKALKLMAEYIENIRLPLLSISLDKSIADTQPFIWKKNKVTPRYTYIVDLRLPIDDILKNMSPERRNDIKKGERSGLNIRMTNSYDAVKSLVCNSFSRQNKIVDAIHLGRMLSDFADEKNSFAFLAEDRNIPVAASFCLFDRETAFYLLGGYAHENKYRGAGPLVCWEAIKYAKQLGLKTFDFEGSMVPDIERYFRDFGGKLIPYYRISKAFLPIEIAMKFILREVF
jgi:hypothetical protein